MRDEASSKSSTSTILAMSEALRQLDNAALRVKRAELHITLRSLPAELRRLEAKRKLATKGAGDMGIMIGGEATLTVAGVLLSTLTATGLAIVAGAAGMAIYKLIREREKFQKLLQAHRAVQHLAQEAELLDILEEAIGREIDHRISEGRWP